MQTQPGLRLPERDSKVHIHAELPRAGPAASTAWRTHASTPRAARDPRRQDCQPCARGGRQRSAKHLLCSILGKKR